MGYIALSHISQQPREVLFNRACQLSFWNWEEESHFLIRPKGLGSLEVNEEYKFDVDLYSFAFEAKYLVETLEPVSCIQFKQTQGLFKFWSHTLHFENMEDGRTLVSNVLSYRLPLGLLGTLFSDLVLRKRLETAINEKWDSEIKK